MYCVCEILHIYNKILNFLFIMLLIRIASYCIDSAAKIIIIKIMIMSFNAHFILRDEDIGGVPPMQSSYSAEMKRYGVCMEERRVHCKCIGGNPRRLNYLMLSEEILYFSLSSSPFNHLWKIFRSILFWEKIKYLQVQIQLSRINYRLPHRVIPDKSPVIIINFQLDNLRWITQGNREPLIPSRVEIFQYCPTLVALFAVDFELDIRIARTLTTKDNTCLQIWKKITKKMVGFEIIYRFKQMISDMIWYDIWYDMIWYDMISDMIINMISYMISDMISDMIFNMMSNMTGTELSMFKHRWCWVVSRLPIFDQYITESWGTGSQASTVL